MCRPCRLVPTLGQLHDLRLVNGFNSSCFGRVEINLNGNWGTVCDTHWDLKDAHVVCKQLQCGLAIIAHLNGIFGEGSRVWLDQTHCTGSEGHLVNCSQRTQLGHCEDGEDAGVICSGPSMFQESSNEDDDDADYEHVDHDLANYEEINSSGSEDDYVNIDNDTEDQKMKNSEDIDSSGSEDDYVNANNDTEDQKMKDSEDIDSSGSEDDYVNVNNDTEDQKMKNSEDIDLSGSEVDCVNVDNYTNDNDDHMLKNSGDTDSEEDYVNWKVCETDLENL
ncbi:hypothetical protein DNTS_007866 [Danionella cerebrum]|uniref:SRCR domain-containing protein n=1 Tax=Danionella cerebrum TaxID=2873325 RepID=A0A553RG31_9TELE|nr:hypothetical protein DNTS_007866 [Danionella translucida]